MKPITMIKPTRINRQRPRSFTLVELLVSMAIIAILAAITVVGVRAVAEGTKQASARNTIEAALETARGYAIKNNTIVMVAFRAKLINESTQVIEAVTAEYTGETYIAGGFGFDALNDRYRPIQEIPARDLPEGIKIAAPFYKANRDSLWVASTDLIAVRSDTSTWGEVPGVIVAVMYGPDGTTRRDNPRSDAVEAWVDFNNDGLQRRGPDDTDTYDPRVFSDTVSMNDAACDLGTTLIDGDDLTQFYCQRYPADEPYVMQATHLAIFNDEEARELYDTSSWFQVGAVPQRIADQSDYINSYADRIHFNRYSGVVMK